MHIFAVVSLARIKDITFGFAAVHFSSEVCPLCRTPSGDLKSADALFADAIRMRLQKRCPEAIVKLEEALAVDPAFSDAACALGYMHEHGDGTAIDVSKAFHWYSLAHKLGHAKATCCLAGMHLSGSGIPKDPQKALSLFKVSHERRHAFATARIAGFHMLGQARLKTESSGQGF